MNMPEYQPHRSAAQADLALKQSIAIQDRAKKMEPTTPKTWLPCVRAVMICGTRTEAI